MGCFFDYLLAYTVQFVKMAGLTDLNLIAIDSTTMEAPNNKFNVIHEDDAKTLLAYYLGHRVTKIQLKELRHPAK